LLVLTAIEVAFSETALAKVVAGCAIFTGPVSVLVGIFTYVVAKVVKDNLWKPFFEEKLDEIHSIALEATIS
jgi:hypothetical protein